MKISNIEILHADGGWRTLSFLKVVTDEGLVGWSEFHESFAGGGLCSVIAKLAEHVVGTDPTAVGAIDARLTTLTRYIAGGIAAQAVGTIENACLDIKAKALGIPVYELFGGALRNRLPLYWSLCGTLRPRFHEILGTPPIASLDDVVALGKEVVQRGFKALKSNIILFEGGVASVYQPWMLAAGPGHPDLNLTPQILAGVVESLAAWRQGVGDEVGLHLDLNFNFKPEGIRRIANAVEEFGLMWLEVDLHEPTALAVIRQSTLTPIASLETIYGRKELRPYLDRNAVDVGIVDPLWNGLPETMRMAILADTYDVNVAPHNYHGQQLATFISAHMAAALPNFRVMEYVADEPSWTVDFLTQPLTIENGALVLPTGPGWGTEINEEAVRARPPRQRY